MGGATPQGSGESSDWDLWDLLDTAVAPTPSSDGAAAAAAAGDTTKGLQRSKCVGLLDVLATANVNWYTNPTADHQFSTVASTCHLPGAAAATAAAATAAAATAAAAGTAGKVSPAMAPTTSSDGETAAAGAGDMKGSEQSRIGGPLDLLATAAGGRSTIPTGAHERPTEASTCHLPGAAAATATAAAAAAATAARVSPAVARAGGATKGSEQSRIGGPLDLLATAAGGRSTIPTGAHERPTEASTCHLPGAAAAAATAARVSPAVARAGGATKGSEQSRIGGPSDLLAKAAAGGKRAVSKGTGIPLWRMTRGAEDGDVLTSISNMEAYEGKSHEELRVEDYVQGRKNFAMAGADGVPGFLRQGTGYPPFRMTCGGRFEIPEVRDDTGSSFASICNMEAYRSRSPEELRMADYMQSRRSWADIRSTGAAAAPSADMDVDEQMSSPPRASRGPSAVAPADFSAAAAATAAAAAAASASPSNSFGGFKIDSMATDSGAESAGQTFSTKQFATPPSAGIWKEQMEKVKKWLRKVYFKRGFPHADEKINSYKCDTELLEYAKTVVDCELSDFMKTAEETAPTRHIEQLVNKMLVAKDAADDNGKSNSSLAAQPTPAAGVKGDGQSLPTGGSAVAGMGGAAPQEFATGTASWPANTWEEQIVVVKNWLRGVYSQRRRPLPSSKIEEMIEGFKCDTRLLEFANTVVGRELKALQRTGGSATPHAARIKQIEQLVSKMRIISKDKSNSSPAAQPTPAAGAERDSQSLRTGGSTVTGMGGAAPQLPSGQSQHGLQRFAAPSANTWAGKVEEVENWLRKAARDKNINPNAMEDRIKSFNGDINKLLQYANTIVRRELQNNRGNNMGSTTPHDNGNLSAAPSSQRPSGEIPSQGQRMAPGTCSTEVRV
eukprot:g13092.t2